MNKCKDCELFKNGCGFSNVDEQLGLNGDFVACGQFVPSDVDINTLDNSSHENDVYEIFNGINN